MRPLFFALAYLVLSLLVGLCGRRRRFGFVGFFLLSLLFTPLFTLLVLYVTKPTRPLEPLPPGRSRP